MTVRTSSCNSEVTRLAFTTPSYKRAMMRRFIWLARALSGSTTNPSMAETTERSLAAIDAALERRLRRLGFTSDDDAWTDRYLLCEHFVDPAAAPSRQRYEAIARFIRDLIAHRWVKTRLAREQANPKRVYYLSMEFLIGRALSNNIINLAARGVLHRFARDAAVLGDGIRPALRLRHVPPVDPQWVPGGRAR